MKRRDDAAEKLIYIVPNYLSFLLKNDKVSEDDKKQIGELRALLKTDYVLSTQLLQYRAIFKKYLKFNYFDINALMHISHFMGLKPATGLNTINNILRLLRL